MSNNTSKRGAARTLTDTPEGRAVPNDAATAADTIAAISAGLPSVAETRQKRTEGASATAQQKDGDHSVTTVYDPHAKIESTPLGVSPEDASMLRSIAKSAGVPLANLQRLNPADVRAARVQARDAAEFADRYAGYKALVESVRS